MNKIKQILKRIKTKFENLSKKQSRLLIYILIAVILLPVIPILGFIGVLGLLILGGVYLYVYFKNPFKYKSKSKDPKNVKSHEVKD